MFGFSKTRNSNSTSEKYTMNKKTQKAISMANQAIKILEERGEEYDRDGIIAENAHAHIMLLLYPNGPDNIPEEVTRYKQISHIIDKLLRYRLNTKPDNLFDIANYSFLLAVFDKEAQHD